ncbi:GAF domain-containing sensor histidine kinase [Undibacterium sp. Dicai25W]|uniref:GAF domain-containing sensor histidine kinase n=1 Tax=Undibacterium sp. Dicai25W TaxID=3413034 RepID=UPI003BF25805
MERLKRLEAVQDVVLEISRISASCNDIGDFLQSVHQSISRLMYAANFYVAIYDEAQNSLRFVYRVDEVDTFPDASQSFTLASPEESPTAWVILNRQPLFMTAADDEARERENREWGNGTRAQYWMGHPLLDQQRRALGAMAIQIYDKHHIYTEEDQDLFGLIAGHVSTALQNLMSVDRLEQAVKQRTAMLEHQVEERRKAESLQRALYQIAELSVFASAEDRKFSRLHQILQELMAVPNFVVALFHEDTQEFSVEYFVDEIDDDATGSRFPLGAGMTSYVVRKKQAQLINQTTLSELIQRGEIQVLGNVSAYSWIGAPLFADDRLYGVIIIQSYQPTLTYTQADLELIAFVANHVAAAFARITADEEVRQAKLELEQKNNKLNLALENLKTAQAELIGQEKLASLGRLVAGVAHEINTPLGICVTATSHMVEELSCIKKDFAEGNLKKDGLTDFLSVLDQALRITTTNIQRGADLVKSFKQVAVDQSSESIREFDMHQYLEEVLFSLQPKLKGKKFEVSLECPKGIKMKTYPGAISQIITNLITNSLLHGFEGADKGKMQIHVELDDESQGHVVLHYRDDGKGMTSAELEKLFEPFYTTKRGNGGSGLGAHIVYNLVTGPLAGQVKVKSEPGQGLQYHMKFPLHRIIHPNIATINSD